MTKPSDVLRAVADFIESNPLIAAEGYRAPVTWDLLLYALRSAQEQAEYSEYMEDDM